MKISQLVSSKNKMPYYESIASRLPRGVKSQQHLLNLGYSVAVRDLGLLKAKTLDEGFASKLINSYHTQSLEEGVGSFLGKAAGNAVGAAGAAGRGLAGAWKDAKAGYAAAKGSWDPKSDKEEPAATGAAPTATATPGPAGTTGGAAQGGTAGAGGISRPYVASPDDAGGAPAAGAAPAGGAPSAGGAAPSTAGNIGDIMKTIDALDRPGKEQLAGELEKSIAGGEKPAPAGMPPQGSPVGTPPAAPGATPPAAQGSTYDPAKAAADKLAKGQADQAAAGQQMAATQQANAASSQADNASVAQVKAIKDKQAAGQLVTSQELRTVKDAAAKGIREAEETKLKKKVVAEFHSKFLGRTI